MSSILELKNLCKAYGAVVVADSLSYALSDGEALGVIGPNGTGKTSMFNLITGTVAVGSGEVYFKGEPITGLSAAARCRAGIARSF